MAFQPAPLPSIGALLGETESNASAGSFLVREYDNAVTKLRVGRKLVAAAASFTMAGQDATSVSGTVGIQWPGPLPSIALLWESAPLYVLRANVGSFRVADADNEPTRFRFGKSLSAGAGSFSASWAPSQSDHVVNAARGTFTLTGRTVLGSRAVLMTAAAGSFAWTGYESAGRVENTTDKRMTALPGVFRVQEYDNTQTRLVGGYVLVADAGEFIMDGLDADLTGPVWRNVPISGGSWTTVTPVESTWTTV